MVPLIDRFVEEHPDFSYRGAKGIVARQVLTAASDGANAIKSVTDYLNEI